MPFPLVSVVVDGVLGDTCSKFRPQTKIDGGARMRFDGGTRNGVAILCRRKLELGESSECFGVRYTLECRAYDTVIEAHPGSRQGRLEHLTPA